MSEKSSDFSFDREFGMKIRWRSYPCLSLVCTDLAEKARGPGEENMFPRVEVCDTRHLNLEQNRPREGNESPTAILWESECITTKTSSGLRYQLLPKSKKKSCCVSDKDLNPYRAIQERFETYRCCRFICRNFCVIHCGL